MLIKKNLIFFFITIILIIFFYAYSKFYKKDIETTLSQPEIIENTPQSSNIMKEILYTSKDADGNEYTISAEKGEIDFSNSNIIFLTNVRALVILKNADNIIITSKFGKYNIDNFDTIFSKNVIITHLDNKITGEYLDFSLDRNSLIISKKVIYNSLNNFLEADVIEMNIKTKDTKIFMYERNKKVKIKSKN